jgi:hypothetical protein
LGIGWYNERTKARTPLRAEVATTLTSGCRRKAGRGTGPKPSANVSLVTYSRQPLGSCISARRPKGMKRAFPGGHATTTACRCLS